MIDLAAGSGEGCKAAVSLRKPCLAFCLSDAHVTLLTDHLIEWMLGLMAATHSSFYNQGYKEWLGKSDPQTKTAQVSVTATQQRRPAGQSISSSSAAAASSDKTKKTTKTQHALKDHATKNKKDDPNDPTEGGNQKRISGNKRKRSGSPVSASSSESE